MRCTILSIYQSSISQYQNSLNPYFPWFFFFFASSFPGASEVERRLHQKIFHNYNVKVRPAPYWEEKVMVRVGMTLSQLVSLVGTNIHNNTRVLGGARLVSIELPLGHHYLPIRLSTE